jgi:hypothetical protein
MRLCLILGGKFMIAAFFAEIIATGFFSEQFRASARVFSAIQRPKPPYTA